MTEKRIVFGCWSNDPHRINEPGQCGILRGRVFATEKSALAFYRPETHECDRGDVIVRIVVEALSDIQ